MNETKEELNEFKVDAGVLDTDVAVVRWSTAKSLPPVWVKAYRDKNENVLISIDKTVARLVPVSESETELILRVEPKQ